MYDEDEIKAEIKLRRPSEFLPDTKWLLMKIMPSNFSMDERLDQWKQAFEEQADTDIANEIRECPKRGIVQLFDRFEAGELKCADHDIDVMCLQERTL